MTTITANMVSELRSRTGAGIMDCKKALAETGGDVEAAIEHLRKTGIAKAEKKAGRATAEGLVHAYIHEGGKIGVLVEVGCETDFVARNEDFQGFVNDIAMHIAAADPVAVSREDVPADVVEREKNLFIEQAKASGKPDNVVEKMVEGRLGKFYAEIALLEQEFVKDPDKTVEDLLKEKIATLGENMQIRRFVRYKLGEE
jgi:elongation factor Ts